MSRDFDAVDDVILATITAMDAGDWTMGAWVRPDTVGENSSGGIIIIGASSDQTLHILDASFHLRATQRFTTVADTRSTSTIAASVWSCVIATFTNSDKKCRIYTGTLSAPIAELAYSQQTAGASTRSTGHTAARIGNDAGGILTWDGRIARSFVDARLWTLDEMEAFRQGAQPVNTGTLRGYWPLDSPAASQASDLSGNNAHGAVTGAALAEDPPLPTQWPSAA